MPRAVEHVIHDFAADLLIGRTGRRNFQLMDYTFFVHQLLRLCWRRDRALSALDVALWDALGQSGGCPSTSSLGGANRPSVQAYNTCVNAGPNPDWDRAVHEPGDLAAELADLGYLGMKVWPWDRFAPQLTVSGSTGPRRLVGHGPGRNHLENDATWPPACLCWRRPVTGSDTFELLLEGHSRWDLNMAIRICRALEPIGVLWAEDLCQPDSAEDLGAAGP